MMDPFVLSFRIIMTPTLVEPDTIVYILLIELLFDIICVILSVSGVMRHWVLYSELSDPPFAIARELHVNVGETGASCYNFHSKSLFHKNMQARDFFLT